MQDVKCSPWIKRAITRFDQSAQDFAFRGAAHPDDRDSIEKDYRDAREALERAIAREMSRCVEALAIERRAEEVR